MPTSCTREGVIGTPNDVILLPQRCANDLNLARMVVDQRDLIEGRDLGPAPASTAVRAIRTLPRRPGPRTHASRRRASNDRSDET